MLVNIGKKGGLGRGKKAPRTPSLTHEQQLEILRLLPEGIGSRDQLPYTAQFNDLYKRFSKLTGTRFSKHEFWRGLSRVAKRSRKPTPLFDLAPLGGLPSDLVQFLERTNPWWRAQPSIPTEPFHRWAFDETYKRLKSANVPIVAIRGPRQVGKTTIQLQLVEHLLLFENVKSGRILRVQFDDIPGLGQLKNPVEALVRWFEDHVLGESINAVARRGEDVYLFFDELQNLPRWSAQLKALSDHTAAKILVTGSSALRISQGRESLAGRISTIELGPLRLYEIAGIRRLGKLDPFALNAPVGDWLTSEFWMKLGKHANTNKKTLDSAFHMFSKLGGYPRCHRNIDDNPVSFGQELIEAVVNRTIDHDPVGSGRGKKIDRNIVKEVFRMVCRYAGQSVRPVRFADEIKSVLQSDVKPATVTAAIQFLADAMLIHQIDPLELLLKKQKHAPKLCLCDHFIRNAWLQETVPLAPQDLKTATEAVSTVAGHIIESVVGYYLSGIPGIELAWFPERKNEPEVDFVITIGTRRIPIEIKYRRGTLQNKDLHGIQSFCSKKQYEAPFGLIISQDTFRKINDSAIAIPASYLLILK